MKRLLLAATLAFAGVVTNSPPASAAVCGPAFIEIQHVQPAPGVAPFTFKSVTSSCTTVTSGVAIPAVGVPAECTPLAFRNPDCLGAGVSAYPGTVSITWVYEGVAINGTTYTASGSCTVAVPPPFGFAGCQMT